MSEQMSFVEMVDMARDMTNYRGLWTSFKTVIRLKKWLIDTAETWPWHTFMKDKVYLDGYKKISHWVGDGWDLDRMMIGKIKVEDLEFIG